MGKPLGHVGHELRIGKCTQQPCNDGGNKGRNGNVGIAVRAYLVEFCTQAETQGCGKGCVKEGRPIATELNAETSTCKTCRYGYLPGRVTALALADFVEFFLVAV